MSLLADIGLVAKAAESSGSDTLAGASTYPAMTIDFRAGQSRLGNHAGGLSGPASMSITLGLVGEARKAVNIRIAGLWG